MSKRKKLVLAGIGLIVCIAGIFIYKGFFFVAGKYYAYTGYSKQTTRDLNGAVEDYSKALDYHNTDIKVLVSRGSAYLDLKEYYEAIEDYTEAIKRSPNDPKPHAYRARAYYELGNGTKSIIDYDKAISLDAGFGYAYLNRGVLKYILLKDPSGGCADLKIALELGMADANELLQRGICE